MNGLGRRNSNAGEAFGLKNKRIQELVIEVVKLEKENKELKEQCKWDSDVISDYHDQIEELKEDKKTLVEALENYRDWYYEVTEIEKETGLGRGNVNSDVHSLMLETLEKTKPSFKYHPKGCLVTSLEERKRRRE